MYNKYQNILYTISVIFFLSMNGFSQSPSYNSTVSDSVIKYNSSFKNLDSSLNKRFVTVKSADTSFYNSYGNAEVISLDQLIYLALNNNPQLKSMEYKIEVEKLNAEEKNYLPDPMFEFELDDVMSNFKQIGMINFYLSQMFMFPGKLKLEKQLGLNSASMMEQEKVSMAIDMINMIKMNYIDLYFNNIRIDLNKENQSLMNTLSTAAEARYSVGLGMQMDVFKSQIEASKLLNEEFILRQEQKNILSNLTAFTKVNINGNTKVRFNFEDINSVLEKDKFSWENLDSMKLTDFALEHRPDIKVLQNKIIMSKTDLEMSKKSYLPDFTLKVGYKILPFEEMNAYNFMVGVNLPFAFWSSSKYKYRDQKNIINIKSVSEELDAKKVTVRNEVSNTLNNLMTTKKTMDYYHDIMIPQSENSFKSAQYAYENKMASFLDLLDAFRMYQDSRLMYYESTAMYLKMIVDLEKVTGMNIKN
jgi:outer membrane protein, heavy metal efflux system